MRNLTYIALVLLAVTPTLAQSWQHTTKNDELHAKTVETFTLTGKYLTPPRSVPADLAPSMVVTCTAGKVTQNYFTFGAVIDRNTSSIYPVMMESRIDGKSFNIAGDSVSTDGTAVFFTRVDLGGKCCSTTRSSLEPTNACHQAIIAALRTAASGGTCREICR